MNEGEGKEPQTLSKALADAAKASPDGRFIWVGDEQRTFSDVDRVATSVATGLAAADVRPDDRVGLLSTNRVEMVESAFGCWRRGSVLVPLNAFLKGEFLRHQLEDSDVEVVLVDGSGYAAVMAIADQLPRLRLVVSFDDSPDVDTRVPVASFRTLTANADPGAEVHRLTHDLASILYTSGTTGTPKGCMLTHGYYLRVARHMSSLYGLRHGEGIMSALPLYHAGAQIGVVLAALLHEGTAVVEPEFHASRVVARFAETGANVFVGVGAMASAVLATPPSERDRQHEVRLVYVAPFSPERQLEFEERFGARVTSEQYGQTECFPISYTPAGGEVDRATCGRAADDLEVNVVDEHGTAMAPGVIGEIVVRPRTPVAMFAGYWKRPDATVEAWRGLWHHTGDLGRLDERGSLSFVDRKRDAIRRRGENLSSLQLEGAISVHPAVAEVVVHGVPSEMTEEDIKACIVLAEGAHPSPEELFEFFAVTLPYFAIPRYVEFLDAIPRNALARVMKQELRDRPMSEAVWDFEAMGLTVARELRRSVH